MFFESKLSIPNYSPYLIRERLFSSLEKNLDRSLICLTSDGGYGKTTLVSSFIHEKKLQAIWYELSHIDRDPQVFCSNLKTAISKQISGHAEPYDISSENLENELSKLVTILSTWPERLIIVLDNYQLIGQCKEIESILKILIKNVTYNITFIITSRIRPNLDLVQLKLQNKLKELNTKHLAFTKEEIDQFFNMYGIKLENYELELILSKTEGWGASLQLLQELIKDIHISNRPLFWLKFRGTPDIYEYLASEVLSSQSETVKSFLFKTSLLADLNVDVINEYLDIENAHEILTYLLNNHIFIYKNEFGTMSYHKIFQAFLYDESLKSLSRSDVDYLHKKLSIIYEKRGDYFSAHAHAIVSNNFRFAAKMMKKINKQYEASQFFVLIDKLEKISPDGSLTASTMLYLSKNMPLETSKHLIKYLESKIMKMGNTHSLIVAKLQHQLGGLYFYTGDLNKAEHLCKTSMEQSLANKDTELSSINFSLMAMITWFKGNLDEAIQFAQLALSYPDENKDFHAHHIAKWILSEVYLDKNELEKGKFLLIETLSFSSQRQDSSIVYPYCSMGKYYRMKGDYEKAIEWIKDAEEIALEFNLEFGLGWVNIEFALTYIEIKDYKQAKHFLSESSKILAHSEYLRCLVKRLQVSTYQQLEELTKVTELKEQIQFMIKNMNYYWLNSSTGKNNHIFVKENENVEKKLYLYTLGKFEIKHKNKDVIKLKRKSSLQILQYLIAFRDRKVDKETIIDNVFPDGKLDSVNNIFYVSLSELRKAIEPIEAEVREDTFIKRNMGHYSLSMDQIYLDADEFIQLVEKDSKMTKKERIHKLKKAEQLYRGDFFEEYLYNDFLKEERDRLHAHYLSILQELADYSWNNGDLQEGINYYEKSIKADPYQEMIYLDFIEHLLEEKFYLQAKKVSKQYKKFIELELGIPVDDKVQTLFRNKI